MEVQLNVKVIKEKSFDPNFMVKVSYDDGETCFKDEVVSVSRKPPKVRFVYSETIEKVEDRIDIKKIELEILRVIVESLLSGKRL